MNSAVRMASESPASPRLRAPPRAWVVLAILGSVYIINFLDRQLLSILAKPIQDELGVTDAQLGRISGLYFALFYCIIAIPVGWLADRTNRVRVLSLACALWSAATVACGLVSTYPGLAAARMSVGVGEAGGVPPSHAIISDYFPPHARGTALGLYNLGPPLGQALGVAFGASIAAAYSWRRAFILLGAVGLVAAIVVFVFVRDPTRGGLDMPIADASTGAITGSLQVRDKFWATCRYFFTHRILLLVSLASGATQFVTYATINFTTLFLMREKGMTLHDIAVYYALLVGIGIGAGIYTSGRMIDRWVPKSKSAYATVPAVALAAAIPFFLGFVWAPRWPVGLLFLAGPMFLNYFYLSPAIALVQQTVLPQRRVLSSALLLLVMNLIGLGLGPTYLGAASDYFRTTHPNHSLQLAFYTLVPFYILAVALYLALARALRADHLRRAEIAR